MNGIVLTGKAMRDHVSWWLDKFEQALRSGDRNALSGLFASDSHWRDMLAFTWCITPHEGRELIVAGLLRAQPDIGARNFRLSEDRTPPRQLRRLGRNVIEAIFSFETEHGRCNGVLRLPTDHPKQARLFSSSLSEIKGHEESVGDRRPTGESYSRNFGGENWSDIRNRERAFADREPEVLVVGASQFGVTMAARLRLLNVDTLVVERLPRVGDMWRNRYHVLALHNQVGKNHFPYLPFPPNWPKYLAKDMLANWIEAYSWIMECNVWTSTTFVGGRYDEDGQVWDARIVHADGSERVLRPRHIIFANGVLGGRKKMNVAGIEAFKGELLHTEDYKSGERYKGRKVLVLGTGTSGHDCAQDLHCSGAEVKMIQRGSSTIVSLEGASLSDSLYLKENLPLDDADLIAVASTPGLIEEAYQINTKAIKALDQPLLDGLEARGFKLDFGPNGTGYQGKVRVSHGGYYINCGCSELIVSGEIGLLHWENVERFVADGVLMKDGRVEKADLIVLATGFYSQLEVVDELLGPEVAGKVGPVWSAGPNGELSNMWVPTAQPGLWFVGGGLAHNRIYSRYLALQIKARQLGLIKERTDVAKQVLASEGTAPAASNCGQGEPFNARPRA